MKKRTGLLALLLTLALTLAACGGEKYEAQAINEATDVCVICKMAVKDDQYATQIVTKDGQSLKFDDIGCLNTWKTENGTDTIGAAFVRDYNSKQWLRYEKAYYVYDSSIQTPMAYGIVSFEKEEDAQSFIDEQGAGKLMTADDLANHSWEVNRDMMNMDGHGHSDSSGDAGMDGHMSDGENGHSAEEEGHDDGGQAS
ncbi:nitrous oxide reductase accessory protein NosL [Paenibacillus arenilitoris]|uniref:Nitrous oxide reductase accessory protein NosL n=1 Tax=Paenibacillus arenilitoris TaxID=2772299 RepID=A0A927CMQ5_9BACL|nr:nitrous oxide reductase accessory protein NosL [Paenibacillus arenilitoris]MBD2869001.1 nitrous oxide reductase accessory protein NosL [Paenibacillus arenilitoris]